MGRKKSCNKQVKVQSQISQVATDLPDKRQKHSSIHSNIFCFSYEPQDNMRINKTKKHKPKVSRQQKFLNDKKSHVRTQELKIQNQKTSAQNIDEKCELQTFKRLSTQISLQDQQSHQQKQQSQQQINLFNKSSKVYQCQKCGKLFNTYKNFNHHQRQKHPAYQSSDVKIEDCEKHTNCLAQSHNNTNPRKQQGENAPEQNDINKLSFMDKICFCSQRFTRFQNFHRHISKMHPKLTQKQQLIVLQIKRKSDNEFQRRMQKYRGSRIQLLRDPNNTNNKLNHTTRSYQEQIFPHPKQKLQHDYIQRHCVKSDQSMDEYSRKPYIFEMEKNYQRQFYKLTLHESIMMKKMNKFFSQCICHEKFKYLGSMIKHIRYKHATADNLDFFYLQHYLHRITKVHYCRAVMITSQKEKDKNLENGCLSKLSLAHRPNKMFYSETLMKQFQQSVDLRQDYQAGDYLSGFRQMGIRIKFLGYSTIERFRYDCRRIYDIAYNLHDVRHVSICFCKIVMYHIESIRRHVRIAHGYVFNKNQNAQKSEQSATSKQQYYVRTFCEGRILFHIIQEIKTATTKKEDICCLPADKNIALYQKQAQILLNKIKKQQNLKISHDDALLKQQIIS